jgi:hypothetical protein
LIKIMFTLMLGLTAWPAAAQDRVPLTARYDYEFVHLNMGDGTSSGAGSLLGAVFMGDTTTSTLATGSSESRLNAYIRDGSTGQVIIDCNFGIGAAGPGTSNDNIVAVGPFAQEAHGDAADFLDHAFDLINQSLAFPCASHRETLVPDTLTVDCAYQGLPIGTAPGHHTFTSSGTYVGTHPSEAGNKFSQRVQQGPIRCILNVDGVEYETHGWLTRMQETRTGLFIPPRPLYEEPHGWIRPEDLRPIGLHP